MASEELDMSKPWNKDHYGFTDAELVSYPLVFKPDLLKGEVALVSGAGQGIGKGIAAAFARCGADLVICGRTQEKLDAARSFLEQFGGRVMTHALNIRDPDQVEGLMDRTWAEFGRCDHLINNAGGQFPIPSMDIPDKGWRAVIDNNLNGTWYMMQRAARRWRDHGQPGSIVNIIIVLSRGQPQVAHTCASRAGVVYLSKSLAVEWAPHNIRVNCVAPGAVESSGFATYPEEGRKSFYTCAPMQRVGNVFDIAEACIYYSSHSGNFVTGETIDISGGSALWGEMWPAGKPDYFKNAG